MPSRVIRGEINASHSLSRVSLEADLTFRALIVAVDDYGRMEADPLMLKAALFPRRESIKPAKVREWVEELAEEGCVVLYRVCGVEYLGLTGWETHRGKTNRAKVSRFPDPQDAIGPSIESPGDSRDLPESPSESRSREMESRGGGAPPGAPARSARVSKTPPPNDLPDEEKKALEAWTREKLSRYDLVPRLPSLVDACLTHFRAKGEARASWYATCQTWVRNEAEGRFAPRGNHPQSAGRSPPSAGSLAERRERAKHLYAVKTLLPDDTLEALAEWEAKGSPQVRGWWLPEAERVRIGVQRGRKEALPF